MINECDTICDYCKCPKSEHAFETWRLHQIPISKYSKTCPKCNERGGHYRQLNPQNPNTWICGSCGHPFVLPLEELRDTMKRK